jgi:hypothetical protein
MNAVILTLAISSLVINQLPGEAGEIHGVVVNATRDGIPAGGVEVVLRLRIDGQFVPVGQTATDTQGRFRFGNVPIDGDYLYLPGANRGGVHYPGPRVRLTPFRRQAHVELQVHETQSQPNPLVAKRHVIRVQPEPGALRVMESILVSNPTLKTYVGSATDGDAEPVTLSLAIPPNFERTTFHKEFFGRRFSLSNKKLVTSIPWTPGETELAYTYVVPNETKQVQWRRPLDLPCADVRIYVTSEHPEEVRCNLGNATDSDEAGDLAFASRGPLEPGYVLRVGIGRAPVPWSSYARWVAATLLVCLVGGTGMLMVRRRKIENLPTTTTEPASPQRSTPKTQRRRRAGRQRRNRQAA